MQAERAWAHAMDLKNDVEQNAEPAKRHRLLARLAKAARHATELVQLTSARCDARSALEAEAYASWMAGSLLLEKETDWEGALARYVRSKKLLEELFKVGSFEQRATCRHFLDQVEPAVRFCEYQIGREGGKPADASALLDAAAGAGPGADVLASKLASLAAEAQAQRASATSEVHWNGETLPVRDERCRVAVHAARELQTQLEEMSGSGNADGDAASAIMEGLEGPGSEVGPRIALFDRTINAYSEAQAAVRAALQLGSQGSDAEKQREELTALGRALRGLELENTISRNLALAEAAAVRFDAFLRRQLSGKSGGKDRGERPARAEDVARLYDTLSSNASELNDLAGEVGGAAGETLMDECAAKMAHFQAARCVYAAHALLVRGQNAAAAALFGRAEARCKQAVSKHDECASPDVAAKSQLAKLTEQSLAYKAVAIAELRAQALRQSAAAAKDVQSLELEEVKGTKRAREDVEGKYLVDDMDEWSAFAGAGVAVPRIARIPQPPALLPIRPIVLDTALMCIKPPSVQHRAPKKDAGKEGQTGTATGMVSRLFGWK
jgi:signal recognition particle subunit SRP68